MKKLEEDGSPNLNRRGRAGANNGRRFRIEYEGKRNQMIYIQ